MQIRTHHESTYRYFQINFVLNKSDFPVLNELLIVISSLHINEKTLHDCKFLSKTLKNKPNFLIF